MTSPRSADVSVENAEVDVGREEQDEEQHDLDDEPGHRVDDAGRHRRRRRNAEALEEAHVDGDAGGGAGIARLT